MAKRVINGKAAIYTDSGVEIVPAYVRRIANCHGDSLEVKPQVTKGVRYILIGGGGKVFQDKPNNSFAAEPMPFLIDRSAKYADTKFFRLILDLMKLAQFDPLAGFTGIENAFGLQWFTTLKNPREPADTDINFDLSIAEIDAQLYKKYNFTPAMIEFVERRYSYDDGR